MRHHLTFVKSWLVIIIIIIIIRILNCISFFI